MSDNIVSDYGHDNAESEKYTYSTFSAWRPTITIEIEIWHVEESAEAVIMNPSVMTKDNVSIMEYYKRIHCIHLLTSDHN